MLLFSGGSPQKTSPNRILRCRSFGATSSVPSVARRKVALTMVTSFSPSLSTKICGCTTKSVRLSTGGGLIAGSALVQPQDAADDAVEPARERGDPAPHQLHVAVLAQPQRGAAGADGHLLL